MLNGDSGVSNTDPYNKDIQPAATNNWVQTGPHVMIVGTDAKTMFQSYPRDANADPTKPYVMWPGTPYEHLMLPVNRSASAGGGASGAVELAFMPSAMDVTLLN